MAKLKVKSWELSDAFWEFAEPLIPTPKRVSGKTYKRKVGGGRKPINPKTALAAILYALRTGIQWKAIPKEIFGSPSAIHAYFQKWEKEGFFRNLWITGLMEFDEMEGIAWEWQSVDSSTGKAPLAREAVGPNPTDREKKWNKKTRSRGRAWHPVVDRRNRSEQARRNAIGAAPR